MENNNTTAVERELDWDDEISNEGMEYVLLPEGDYPFQVISMEKARHTPSPTGKLPPCNKAVLSLRLTGADGKEATVKKDLFLHSSQEWKLCEFFEAIGARKHGEPLKMNWGTVVGSTGTCHAKVRVFDRRDGGKGESNEVTKFYPHEEAPAYTPGKF